MKKGYKNINESTLWGDIIRQGSGLKTKIEDDVNILDGHNFCDYLENLYDVIDCDFNIYIDINNIITVPILKYDIGSRSYCFISFDTDKKIVYFDEDTFAYHDDKLLHKIKKTYKISSFKTDFRTETTVSPKNGETTNKFFIEVIDFIIKNKSVFPYYNVLKKTVNESTLWGDIIRQGSGLKTKIEDERHKILERLLATYIKLFAESCYYHDEYTSGSYPDFRAYIEDFRDNPRIEEACPDDSYFDDLLDYVNMETWNDQIVDTIMEMTDRLDKGEHLITNDVIEVLRKHNVNESTIWGDIIRQGSGIKTKIEDEFTEKDRKDLDELIVSYGNEVVYSRGMSTEACNLDDFCDYIENDNEIKDLNKDKILQYVKDYWADEVCDGVDGAIEQAELEYHQDMNESILKKHNVNESTLWGDIIRQGSGIKTKIEDDINNMDLESFWLYIIDNYEDRVYHLDKDHFWRDYEMDIAVVPSKYIDIYGSYVKDELVRITVVLKTKEKDETVKKIIDISPDNFRWIRIYSDRLELALNDGGVTNQTFVDLIEFFLNNQQIFESTLWGDIIRQGSGLKTKIEDEMTNDDFLMLRETAKMFLVGVRNYENPKNRKYAPRRIDGQEGFIDYILERKNEHFWSDTPDEAYDKVIKFVKDNWGDCTGIQDFMDKYLSNINECDGVPGGLTPANVGGMGAAYFPGPNGEPGSGDLPSPTGIVYHQVAPYTVFLKELKKKKKKKKFRIEDEPCAHSKNSKTYDYVDDFREYVDRTYNNIDRRK